MKLLKFKIFITSILLTFCYSAFGSGSDALDKLNERVYTTIYQNQFTTQDLAENALRKMRSANYSGGEAEALVNLAMVYYYQGRNERALNEILKAEEIINSHGIEEIIGKMNLVKGMVAYSNDNLDIAFLYTRKGVRSFLNNEENLLLSHAYNNLGVFHCKGPYKDSIHFFYQLAGNTDPANPYPWINLGKWQYKNKQYKKALNSLHHALDLAQKQQNIEAMTGSYLELGVVNYDLNNHDLALKFYKKAASFADEAGMLHLYSQSNNKLYRYYQNRNDQNNAFAYYQKYVQSQEVLNSRKNQHIVNDLLYKYENDRKEEEMKLLREKSALYTWLSYMGGGSVFLILIFSLVLWERYRKNKILSDNLEYERNQFKHLLLNILPKEIAEELKVYGKAKAKKHKEVSILFADVRNFTHLSEDLLPEDLVYELDKLYSEFDKIMQQNGVEKIKTIGDAYLCVCGLPKPTDNHAIQMTKVALEMQNFVKQQKSMHRKKEMPYFQIRIGIHSGSVIAGVVGKKKFAYDIWGNAVNIAARMEQNSVPGKINVSEDTFHLIKNYCICTPRGEIEVKNKGCMNMYFVDSMKASDDNGML